MLWCVLGIVSATGAQMYGVVAGLLQPPPTGELTSINLAKPFIGAFVVQWAWRASGRLAGRGMGELRTHCGWPS